MPCSLVLTLADLSGPPSPPTNLHKVSASPAFVVIAWSPPENDGGAPVASYQIKKRRTGRKAWQDVGESAELTFNIPGLVENSNYDFAVFAVNKNGPSEPAVLEDVYAKHSFTVPSPPGQPKVLETAETSATIDWTPPESDGGNPITGYDVYLKTRTSTQWRRVTKVKTTTTRYTFDSLEKEIEYEARVIAWNTAGESEPSKASEPFKLTMPKLARQQSTPGETTAAPLGDDEEDDRVEKPSCRTDQDYLEVVEGEDAVFVVQFTGKPVPTITWKSTSDTFQAKNHFELTTTTKTTTCVIKKCKLEDTGDILVTFKNKGAGWFTTLILCPSNFRNQVCLSRLRC